MNILKTCWSASACLCMLWILAGTNAVRAQDGAVAGRVTGAEGDSLPGVNVVLLETTYGDATATDGTYHIRAVPPGAYRIQASSIGFSTEIRQIEVMADETILVDFVLEPIAIESREIVVTTTRRTADARNIPASVSVLTADDLVVRNVLALDDALQYVPGVQLTGNEVNIRGSSGFSYNTGSRILLLVDGMPMLSPDAERIPFELIPVHQIERIEVLKGPARHYTGVERLAESFTSSRKHTLPNPKRLLKPTEERTNQRTTRSGADSGRHQKSPGRWAASPSTMPAP